MKIKKHNFFPILFILGFVFGFLSFDMGPVDAKVTVEATPVAIYAGIPFQIPIVISTTESVNALEGEFVIPTGVTISGVGEGSSIISIWVEKPEFKNGRIRFVGIIPGGVTGTNLLLFTIRGTAGGAGEISLGASNLIALANDGKGSAVSVSFNEKSIQVLPVGPNTQIPLVEKDTTPPSPFSIQIGKDETVYGGKPFAVFETTDKESGISRYESSYSFWPIKQGEKSLSWKKIEGPLMLSENFWPKYLYVRAVDLDGNTQVSVLSPQKGDFKYLGFFLLVMIVVILAKRILHARRFRL